MRAIVTLFICILCIGCQKYQGPSDYVRMQYAIEDYGQNVAKTCGLRLLVIDNVTNDPKVVYCLAFTSDKSLIMEEAKALARDIRDDFLHMLQHDPSVRRYAVMKEEFPKKQVIGLKISFWNRDMDRIKQPYIAEIQCVGDTFYYYVADPDTEELRLVWKETDVV